MFRTLRTTDYDELTAAEEGWEIRHRPVRPEKFEGHVALARVGSLGVIQEQLPGLQVEDDKMVPSSRLN